MNPPPPAGAESVDRRTFLKLGAVGVGTLAGEGAAAPPSTPANPGEDQTPAKPGGQAAGPALVDVNVYLSRWPFRRLPGDEPPALVAKLRAHGVVQAWAGSFDALLHRDMAAVNARLADACRRHGDGLLVPFGAINPKLPGWEEDLDRCRGEYAMPGIRLHPNYHGYKLDDHDLARALERASDRGLVVQIAAMMEDERTQHPLVRVPHVDLTPLIELAGSLPRLRLVLLNAFRLFPPKTMESLAARPNVSFEIATLEGVGGVGNLIGKIGADRILFGSYYPFFCFESAALKLKESAVEGADLAAITSGNAKKVMNAR